LDIQSYFIIEISTSIDRAPVEDAIGKAAMTSNNTSAEAIRIFTPLEV
jgi:hypothetical protein